MEHSSSAIRAAIATAAKTKKLDLSFLQLTSIPASALKLKHLEELNLSNNLLEDIPSSISQLVSLKKFDISCNKLTHISDHIASCTALENLNLSNNLLSSIPNTISTLNKLKTINVYNNKLDIAEHITQTPAKLQAYLRIKLEERMFTLTPCLMLFFFICFFFFFICLFILKSFITN